MLEFYYDCLRRYLDWDDFQILQTDTDALYNVYGNEGHEKLEKVKNETDCWFPSEDHDTLVEIGNTGVKIPKSLYDNYTPGLFKLEKEGTEMIALTSKSYILSSEGVKSAAKGVQKNINELSLEKHREALYNDVKITGANKEFRMNNDQMTTYEQEKIILSNQYSKRVIINVTENGLNRPIYTRPYMPWEIDTEVKVPANKQKANQTREIKNKIGLWNFEK